MTRLSKFFLYLPMHRNLYSYAAILSWILLMPAMTGLFAPLCYGQSFSDSAKLRKNIVLLIRDINESSSDRNEMFNKFRYAQDTLFKGVLKPELKPLAYSIFANIYDQLRPSLESRADEINWAIIYCQIARRNLSKDSAEIHELNNHIRFRFEEGFPVIYQKYRINSDLRSNFFFYAEQFQKHDPENNILVTILSKEKSKQVVFFFIILSIITLIVYFVYFPRPSHKTSTKTDPGKELPELCMTLGLGLQFFQLIFQSENDLLPIITALSIILVFALVRGWILVGWNSGLRIFSSFHFVSGSFFTLSALQIYIADYSAFLFTTGAVASYYLLCRIFHPKTYVSAGSYFLLALVVYALAFKTQLVWRLGIPFNIKIIVPVFLVSLAGFAFIAWHSTFKIIRYVALQLMAFIPMMTVICAFFFFRDTIIIGTVMLVFLGGYWFLASRSTDYIPPAVKKFSHNFYSFLPDVAKAGRYARRLLGMLSEFLHSLNLWELRLALIYCEKKTISDSNSRDQLHILAKSLDNLLKDAPDVKTRFWINCIASLGQMSDRILLIDWMLTTGCTKDAEIQVMSFKDKDSIIKLIPQILELYQRNGNSFQLIDPSVALIPAYHKCYIKDARLNSILVDFYWKKKSTAEPVLFQDYFQLFYDIYRISNDEQLFFMGITAAGHYFKLYHYDEGIKTLSLASRYAKANVFHPHYERILAEAIQNSNDENLSKILLSHYLTQEYTFQERDPYDFFRKEFGPRTNPWLVVLLATFCHRNARPDCEIYHRFCNLTSVYHQDDLVMNRIIHQYSKQQTTDIPRERKTEKSEEYQRVMFKEYYTESENALRKKNAMLAYKMYLRIPFPENYLENSVHVVHLDHLAHQLFDSGNIDESILCMKSINAMSPTFGSQLRLAKLQAVAGNFRETREIIAALTLENDSGHHLNEIEQVLLIMDLCTGKINPNDKKTDITSLLGFDYFTIANKVINHEFETVINDLQSLDSRFSNFVHFTMSYIHYTTSEYDEALREANLVKLEGTEILENCAIINEANNQMNAALNYRRACFAKIDHDLTRFWYLIWMIMAQSATETNYQQIRQTYDDQH